MQVRRAIALGLGATGPDEVELIAEDFIGDDPNFTNSSQTSGEMLVSGGSLGSRGEGAVETTEGAQLLGVSDLGSLQRPAQEVDGGVIGLPADGEGMAILAAVGEAIPGRILKGGRCAVYELRELRRAVSTRLFYERIFSRNQRSSEESR